MEINVGYKLHQLRKEQGKSLRELSKLSGISANAISLIERNKNSPTIATLTKLILALNTNLTFLFEEEKVRDVICIKNGTRPHMESKNSKVKLESLGTGLPNQNVEPLIAIFGKGANSGKNSIIHQGNELIYCLEGEVEFEDSKAIVNTIKPTTHHSGISADGKYLIVPILDGKVYFINRKSMKLKKVVEAKLGAAHVNVSKEENVIVITNHFSQYLTFIDAKSLEVIKHLDISVYEFDPADKHLIQPHFSYIGPKGRYYYTFATQDGMFLKIDLRTLEIVDDLFTDGAPEQAHS